MNLTANPVATATEDKQQPHHPTQPVKLVEEGRARALVVTADNPSPTAAYAAAELVEHIFTATGAELETVTESAIPETAAGRIFIGATKAAARQGLDGPGMEPGSCRLCRVGGDLYLLGPEDRQDPFAPRAARGTLYGVYEFLEKYLQVRWLWPGQLGTYIPPRKTLAVTGELDETHTSPLRFRSFRHRHISQQVLDYDPDLARLAFSPEVLHDYHQALRRFLARHRVDFEDHSDLALEENKDNPLKPPVGHYFSGWWERYGEEHPDWFMMRADGQRGPEPGASAGNVAMCVSNPDLHRFIVEEVWDGGDYLRLGEVDRRVFCQCPTCLSWDVPYPQEPPQFAPGIFRPLVSDRYARFWKTIHSLAAKRNPNVLVTTFIYWNYLPAPLADIRLDGVYGEYVPWGESAIVYYPMSDAAHEWNKDQWRGWHERGTTMAYRPNYLLGGYVLPHLSTRQAGEMFRFAGRNGMIGFDFDSLWAHWAAKGPMLYLHLRLGDDPSREVDAVRKEYFTAFGPAAGKVEDYFDYWERYSKEQAPRGGVEWSNPARANEIYPPPAFAPAARLLDEAMALATEDSNEVYRDRIVFLQTGLEHARLAADFIGRLDFGGKAPAASREKFAAAAAALKRLIDFRRQHEHLFFSDLIAAAIPENRGLAITALLEGDFVADKNSAATEGMTQPWGPWYYRKDPEAAGEAERWFEPGSNQAGIDDFDDGSGRALRVDRQRWIPVRVPARLAETEIGDYLGYGWYATVFTVPREWAGHNLQIHFTAVDEQAWVYVNGQYAGEHTVSSEKRPIGELWDQPFKVTVPAELIRPEEDNLLIVRTHASTGASGIWGPVGAAPDRASN